MLLLQKSPQVLEQIFTGLTIYSSSDCLENLMELDSPLPKKNHDVFCQSFNTNQPALVHYYCHAGSRREIWVTTARYVEVHSDATGLTAVADGDCCLFSEERKDRWNTFRINLGIQAIIVARQHIVFRFGIHQCRTSIIHSSQHDH